MTVLWTTSELPASAFDPEPDDEDNGPWCNTRTPTRHDLRRAELADLHDQGAGPYALRTATTVPTGSYL